MRKAHLSDDLSLDILSRLAKLTEAGGWLRTLPDTDLMINHPDALRLWTILDFLTFQGDQEIEITLEALRKFFGWTRKKMLKEVVILEEKGYISRESKRSKGTVIRTYGVPQNVPTGNKVCSHREQSMFPQGTKYVPTGNKAPSKKSVYDKACETLIYFSNTIHIPLKREECEDVLKEYLSLHFKIAPGGVRNPDAYSAHMIAEIAKGNISETLLRRAYSRVKFPKGWYQAHGSIIRWNGEKGKEYSPFGEFRGIVQELPPDAISVTAPEWAGDAK